MAGVMVSRVLTHHPLVLLLVTAEAWAAAAAVVAVSSSAAGRATGRPLVHPDDVLSVAGHVAFVMASAVSPSSSAVTGTAVVTRSAAHFGSFFSASTAAVSALEVAAGSVVRVHPAAVRRGTVRIPLSFATAAVSVVAAGSVVRVHPAAGRRAVAAHGPAVVRRRTVPPAAAATAATERAVRSAVHRRSLLSVATAAVSVVAVVSVVRRAVAAHGTAVVRRRTVLHVVAELHVFVVLAIKVTRATRAIGAVERHHRRRSVVRARRAAEATVTRRRRRGMPRRTARPTQHPATPTTRAGTSTLLVRAAPPATATASGPCAKKGLALGQPELDKAVRAEVKGAKKRTGFAGPELDAGGSQGRVDRALAVIGLDDATHLVAAALAPTAGAAIRDLAVIVLLLHLVDLGITAAAATGAAVVDSVVDLHRSGILALKELPRS